MHNSDSEGPDTARESRKTKSEVNIKKKESKVHLSNNFLILGHQRLFRIATIIDDEDDQ